MVDTIDPVSAKGAYYQRSVKDLNSLQKNIALWLVISLIFILLYHMFNQPRGAREELIFSDFIEAVDKGQVAEVTIQGEHVYGTLTGGKAFKTYAPKDASLVGNLKEKGVRIAAKPADESPWYMTVLVSWFPTLLLIGVWIFFMRQMQAGGGKAMAFGKSRARLMNEKTKRVTFDDVAGIDEAKDELKEIVEFLRDPKKFTRLGGRIPKGVLLVGPPGTGKTLLARAIAGEADVAFFTISGSDFVEMFVGVGASRVRDLFNQGKRNAPCIIFIDEIDAIGRSRVSAGIGGNDEREQTLNQLLVEMDGFDSRTGVIILAATNRPEILDPALLRPGRFDRQVLIDKPDLEGRYEILKIHTKDIKLSPDVDLHKIAQGAAGLAGADLANIANEAALMAVRSGRKKVNQTDFEEAIEKSVAGLQRKSRILTEDERKKVAYHETGHALTAFMTPGAQPVTKISIIPRGMSALGYTLQYPTEDRFLMSESELLGNIDTMLGGRAAEEVVFGEISTGAGNDISRASDLVRRMITEFGMSDKYRNITLPTTQSGIAGVAGSREYSEQAQEYIDSETARIVNERYAVVKGKLEKNRKALDAITSQLLEHEVIEGKDFEAIAKAEVID